MEKILKVAEASLITKEHLMKATVKDLVDIIMNYMDSDDLIHYAQMVKDGRA